ncbi:MAG: UDP-N-acetylmuramoyl-L-alanyl-D-glutamate--2,6-diaminopimelate ligase, partial [Deltaproteobacteria bacterium]
VIKVPDSRKALARLASVFFGWPQRKLDLIGITGTNGKTTTSYLVETIFEVAGLKPAVIGTINYRCGNTKCPAPVTTPESLDLMRAFTKAAKMGATHAVVEVSSHALDQGRVSDCRFKVGVFTNLSRDHLDYHGSMEDYFQAKSLLFTELLGDTQDSGSVAVINVDNPYGRRLAQMATTSIITYGLDGSCDVTVRDVDVSEEGIKGRLISPAGEKEVFCPLVGRFNLYNTLAAVSCALCLDIPLEAILEGLSSIVSIPGRLETVKNSAGITVLVDYAHTPDALEKVLRDLRSVARKRIITVFGCGGDRDKGKRPEMGRIAVAMSDLVVITSDNPRTEDPQLIVEDIIKGAREVKGGASYMVELDREKAIEAALSRAGKGDVVLIAGKGHEDYQIVGTQKRPFDDRKVAAQILARIG